MRVGPHAYGPGVNIGWPLRFAFLTSLLWHVTSVWQAIRRGDQGPAEGS
jgi:hypothetical protein